MARSNNKKNQEELFTILFTMKEEQGLMSNIKENKRGKLTNFLLLLKSGDRIRLTYPNRSGTVFILK